VSKVEDNQAVVNEQGFVSMLVHELRTPLTALRGSLGLLADEVKDAAPEVRSFAALAARNADRLVSMLADAADYWRLNDSATPPNCESTDVVDTVQRAIEQVQTLADERGIVLDVRATPAEASVDPALIRMAVARVLSYALRVSPKMSRVQVRIETVEGQPGAGVVVSVSDGGKVVAADCIARMFEPFSAVARRGVEPTMPTGLGLAIALEIAELHGGSLVFTSTEQGGLFSLRLPA